MREDIVYALRMLRKTPLLSAIAVLALALGIGANAAIFSVVHSVLLQPLPFPAPQQLVQVCRQNRGGNQVWVSIPNLLDWQRQNSVFSGLAGYVPSNFNLGGQGGTPERVGGLRVDTDFLTTLGVHPALGGDFRPRDDQPGRSPVAIISHRLWQTRFGGRAEVVGQAVEINDEAVPVLGVLPAGFRFPGHPDVLEPLQPEGAAVGRGANTINAIGRIKRGTTLAAAQAQMHAIGKRLEQQYPKDNEGQSVGLVPLQQQWTGAVGPALWMLFGAVGLVLLIACADLANLLLARSLGRQREMAVRMALGAERGRIVRQLLTESVVLALLGGAAGLGIAYAGMRGMLAWAPVAEAVTLTPTVGLGAALDGTVLAFTFILAVITGIVFGLAPALHTAKANLNATLQQSSGRTAGHSSRRLRSLLVVGEIALTLPLLLGAGMLLASLAQLRNRDAGFNPDHLLTAHLALAPSRYRTTADIAHFADGLLPRLRALPGVRAAGMTIVLPLTLCPDFPFTIGGRSFAQNNVPDAEWHPSTPQTFAALGVPILSGRGFQDSDNAGAAQVAIINQEAAATWWPHQDPIGQTVWIGKPNMPPAFTDPGPRTIVGVVGNVRQDGLAYAPPPALYIPLAQTSSAAMALVLKIIPMALVVRTEGDPAAAAGEVREAVASVDPQQPVSDLLSMRAVENTTLGPHQFNFALLGIFAGLALALAALGIYGVMAYGVAERRREIGLRMALGEGAKLAVAGIVLGGVAAWLLQKTLAHQVSGFARLNPWLAAAVGAGLLAVALGACLAPAARAAGLDPQTALRQE